MDLQEKRRDEAKDEILDKRLTGTWCNKGEKTIYTDPLSFLRET